MKKSTKIWLITAFLLILAGAIIIGGTAAMLKWDFSKLTTVKMETREHSVAEDFEHISILADTADILFVPAPDGGCRVVCYEQSKAGHRVTVENNSLVIALTDNRAWYEKISIFSSSPKITVYLPGEQYGAVSILSDTGDVKIPADFSFTSIHITESTGDVTVLASATEHIQIQTSTGDIQVEDLSAAVLSLRVNTGKITARSIACQGEMAAQVSTGRSHLTDVTCQSLISTGNTGDITMKNVVATEKISITRSTGDVHFDGCDGGDIFVDTDTGSVTGTLLSGKIFFTHTDTGKIRVPHSMEGGRCEIRTDTGDIRIDILS